MSGVGRVLTASGARAGADVDGEHAGQQESPGPRLDARRGGGRCIGAVAEQRLAGDADVLDLVDVWRGNEGGELGEELLGRHVDEASFAGQVETNANVGEPLAELPSDRAVQVRVSGRRFAFFIPEHVHGRLTVCDANLRTPTGAGERG